MRSTFEPYIYFQVFNNNNELIFSAPDVFPDSVSTIFASLTKSTLDKTHSVACAGVHFINHPNWSLGVVANYIPDRKEKDSHYLKGLGDIDSYIDVGVFAAWRPEPFSFSLQAFKGTNREGGLHVTAAVSHTMAFFDKLQIEQSLATTYANSRYNNLYFGIDRKQSLNSKYNYQEYHAGSGIKDVSFSIEASYPITEKFSTMLMTEYKYLTGPAAKSPLVKEGSKHQGLIGAGIIYTF